MPTKKELEETIKKKNGLLREAKAKIAELLEANPLPTSDNLDEKAFAIIKRNGKFKEATIAFNAETKQAEVVEIKDASNIPEAVHMAHMRAKILLEEMIDKAINSER